MRRDFRPCSGASTSSCPAFVHPSNELCHFRHSSTNASSQEQKPAEAASSPDTSTEGPSQAEQKSDVDIKQMLELNAKLSEDVSEFKVNVSELSIDVLHLVSTGMVIDDVIEIG